MGLTESRGLIREFGSVEMIFDIEEFWSTSNRVADLVTTSVEDCAMHCLEHHDCQYISYDIENSEPCALIRG